MLLSLVMLAGFTGAHPNPFSWEGELAPGQAIEVQNTYGSILAQAAAGGHAEVLAQNSGIQVSVTRNPHGVSIRAVPAENPELASPVDFVVSVPPGVRFIGRTINGNVEARALHGNAAGYTVNGDVRISADGATEAVTVNGSVTVSLETAATVSRALRFTSVNGGVTLLVPDHLRANLRASTLHGRIQSDFPLAVQALQSGEGALGMLGGGGPELRLATVNGSIRLRRKPGA